VFADSVELISAPSYTIDNKYGKYIFDVSIQDPQTLIISSAFVVRSEIVQPENIEDVIEIQEAIHSIDNQWLEFKKL
jgi:hypothetical protein